MFRYKFCKGFFEKNGRWPVVHLLDDVRDDIVTSVKGGQWLERGGDAWRANDFNGVVLGKTLEFNMFLDPSDLMKDTATSRGRYCWADEYDSQAFRTLYGHWPPKPQHPEFESKVLSQFFLDKIYQWKKSLTRSRLEMSRTTIRP